MARILVVDDDSGMRLVLNRLLTANGYAVSETASGAETLAWLEGHVCDLMILDLLLGDLHGASIVAWVEEHRHGLPIVVLSGATEADLKAIRPKVYLVMPKPPTWENLLPAVADVLKRK